LEKLTIALISGGDSSERQVSLNSGDQVYEALNKDKYRIQRYDPKTDLAELASGAPQIDAALIILHGPLGEDGTIQGMLDLLDIPYQGSGVLGSALAMDKLFSKQMYVKSGLLVPPYLVATESALLDPEHCVDTLGLPLVVKPVAGGSSIGMSIVRSKDDFKDAVEKALAQDHTALIESYISGTELTCSVIGNDQLETYPVVEIRPGEGFEFFDYQAKYTAGATKEICPADIPEKIAMEVKSTSITAHNVLKCRGYSRTDFILNGGKLFVIETNTIPGMTRTSLLPLSAQVAGIEFSSLLDKLIILGIDDYIRKINIRNRKRLQRSMKVMPILKK
jgi:D-alanine-D-alanine ligase